MEPVAALQAIAAQNFAAIPRAGLVGPQAYAVGALTIGTVAFTILSQHFSSQFSAMQAQRDFAVNYAKTLLDGASGLGTFGCRFDLDDSKKSLESVNTCLKNITTIKGERDNAAILLSAISDETKNSTQGSSLDIVLAEDPFKVVPKITRYFTGRELASIHEKKYCEEKLGWTTLQLNNSTISNRELDARSEKYHDEVILAKIGESNCNYMRGLCEANLLAERNLNTECRANNKKLQDSKVVCDTDLAKVTDDLVALRADYDKVTRERDAALIDLGACESKKKLYQIDLGTCGSALNSTQKALDIANDKIKNKSNCWVV